MGSLPRPWKSSAFCRVSAVSMLKKRSFHAPIAFRSGLSGLAGAASADAVIRTQAFRARGFDPGFSYAEGVAADRLWSWKYEMVT